MKHHWRKPSKQNCHAVDYSSSGDYAQEQVTNTIKTPPYGHTLKLVIMAIHHEDHVTIRILSPGLLSHILPSSRIYILLDCPIRACLWRGMKQTRVLLLPPRKDAGLSSDFPAICCQYHFHTLMEKESAKQSLLYQETTWRRSQVPNLWPTNQRSGIHNASTFAMWEIWQNILKVTLAERRILVPWKCWF